MTLVSEVLSHASVAITLETYVPVLPGAGRDIAERVGRMMKSN